MNNLSPEPTELNIMLITHAQDNVKSIKKALKTLSCLPDVRCHLWRCKDASLTQALAIHKRYEIDIVLLCMAEEKEGDALQSLYAVLRAFPDAPVITLSGEDDKALALAAIEEGAASNVTYEDLHADTGRLTTAIEYMLARYKSATVNKAYVRDALKYLRKRNRSDLRTARATFAQDLQDEKDRSFVALDEQKSVMDKKRNSEQADSAIAVRQEQNRSAIAIKNEQQYSADAVEEREMVIRWMSGSYSVQKVPLV